MMDPYQSIIHEAASEARRYMAHCAIIGKFESAKVWYRPGKIRVAHAAPGQGWTDSGILLPITLPYNRYYPWLFENCGQLEVL